MARKKQHYVDNERFLEVMGGYREKFLESKDNETERPMLPDYAGECFLKIAERLSHRPNFINYAFKEEMISDGIENCLHYIYNFNPEKSSNPFAYFTQIIYYAFIRRIQKEKKQLYIKYKSMQNYQIMPEYMDIDRANDVPDPAGDYTNSDFKIVVDNFVETFEQSKKKKIVKKKVEPSNLELFMGVTT